MRASPGCTQGQKGTVVNEGSRSGGTLVMSGASGGGQPPDRRPDKFTGHYAPDAGPFKPLTGIKMAPPGPIRRPMPQPQDAELPRGRPRSNSAPPALFPEPYVAALDGQSVFGPAVLAIQDGRMRREMQSSMSITDRGALGGSRRMGAAPRVNAQGSPLGITPDSLSGIRLDAPIHLYGHGGFTGTGPHDPQPVFGTHSPQQLSQELLRGGLPPNYRGTLYANGCNTGTLGPSGFAVALSRELSSQGRFPTIRANRGTAHHFQDGTTGVLPLHREEEHATRTGAVAQETVNLTMESLSPNVTPQRQGEIQQRIQALGQQSRQLEHQFYQRDPSVFVEFPPIRPAPLGRRQSFSGDINSLFQPLPGPRRRNSIGSLQELGGMAPPQPPLEALFANQGTVQGGRPRSKSVGDQGGIQIPKSK